MTKRVAIVAAHFPPSNLAGVHRSRLIAPHLPRFGWRPIIVTTHPQFFSEPTDPTIAKLVPSWLPVIRTKALPSRPKLVGDLGVRALAWHCWVLRRLAKRGIDFCWITIPSVYSAMLGRLACEPCGLPYGIDYIDPWVNRWPGIDRIGSRAWFSYRLSHVLEPWCLRQASLVSGINDAYLRPAIDRNPNVAQNATICTMPYGHEEQDLAVAGRQGSSVHADGVQFRLMYAGAIMPKAREVARQLVRALTELAAPMIKLKTLGTAGDLRQACNKDKKTAAAYAARVDEQDARVPYLDVLNALTQADAVVILGSTEKHYSPSKVFQAISSGRPILAFLHRKSTARALLRHRPQAVVVDLDDDYVPTSQTIVEALRSLVLKPQGQMDRSIPEDATAEHSAQMLASAMDRALGRPI